MAIHQGPLGRLMLGRSDLDRCAHERAEATIARLLDDAGTAVVVLRSGCAEVVDDAIVLRPPIPGEDAGQPLWVFLGRDPAGRGFLARITSEPAVGDTWLGLREAANRLDDRDAGILTTAVALGNWHATHTHCPRCGATTRPQLAGWTRRCTADNSEHYPRTDPAIIVAVIDADDRILLGHNAIWPEGRYSTLAGFVEPGESLEDAVRREVFEEAGVVVGDVTFVASQPWPFPASLMLGCVARADDPAIQVDGQEVTEARWFTRDQLQEEVHLGTVVPPGGTSIARRLVEYWMGVPLADGPTRW